MGEAPEDSFRFGDDSFAIPGELGGDRIIGRRMHNHPESGIAGLPFASFVGAEFDGTIHQQVAGRRAPPTVTGIR